MIATHPSAAQLDENADLQSCNQAMESRLAELNWQLEQMRSASQAAPFGSPARANDAPEPDVEAAAAQIDHIAEQTRRLSGQFEVSGALPRGRLSGML